MKRFAKLFDTEHGQLLVMVDETEEGAPCIVFRGEEAEGIIPRVTLSGWSDPDKADEILANFDQAQAEQAAQKVAEIGKEAAEQA